MFVLLFSSVLGGEEKFLTHPVGPKNPEVAEGMHGSK
jgi:hypothetical protein